jgi:hypothetical protein
MYIIRKLIYIIARRLSFSWQRYLLEQRHDVAVEEDGEAEQHHEDLEPQEGRHLDLPPHLHLGHAQLLGLLGQARGARGGNAHRHGQALHGLVALLAAGHLGHLPARDVGLELHALLLVLLLTALGHDLRPADQVQVQEQQRVHSGVSGGGDVPSVLVVFDK